MKHLMKRKFWIGTAVVLLVGTFLYGCEDFLEVAPKGSLDSNTLANQNGVESTLISAYRQLDRTASTGSLQGGAASNWNFGSMTTDDAYKGTEATDDAVSTQIELYRGCRCTIQ